MKKLIHVLLVTIALLFAAEANAQFGVKLGALAAKQKLSLSGISVSSDSRIGFQVGAYYDYGINETLKLRTGLQYSQKGSKNEDPDNSEEEVSVAFDYIELPVELMYNFPIGSYTMDIMAGPYLGYLLSARSDGESSTEGTNRMEYGYSIGLKFNLDQISVGINTTRGLSNMLKEMVDVPDVGIDIGDFKAKNLYTALFVNYNF